MDNDVRFLYEIHPVRPIKVNGKLTRVPCTLQLTKAEVKNYLKFGTVYRKFGGEVSNIVKVIGDNLDILHQIDPDAVFPIHHTTKPEDAVVTDTTVTPSDEIIPTVEPSTTTVVPETVTDTTPVIDTVDSTVDTTITVDAVTNDESAISTVDTTVDVESATDSTADTDEENSKNSSEEESSGESETTLPEESEDLLSAPEQKQKQNNYQKYNNYKHKH